MPRIFSYVITHDHGFAPNPFAGLCTLATCKPVIRRTAKIGDWLLGTGSKSFGLERCVIYAAKIEKMCTLAEYGANPQYAAKRPSAIQSESEKHGDNIYYRDERGEWAQRKNIHHDGSHMEHDLSGANALIASHFWYFGSSPQQFPDNLLHIIKKGPGHKCVRSPESQLLLQHWLSSFTPGVSSRSTDSGRCGGC